MKFSIRTLVKSDCESYRDLRLKAFQESSESFSESYEDEHQQQMEFFLTLMGESSIYYTVGGFSLQNELVAIATFKRDQRHKARHKSYIHTMYVAPEFRGHGIARGILEKLIEEARTLPGLEQIHLWVLNPSTSAARKLYLKTGFKPQGPIVKKDLFINGSYVDAEYMTLELNE